jgi:hypothetical protein
MVQLGSAEKLLPIVVIAEEDLPLQPSNHDIAEGAGGPRATGYGGFTLRKVLKVTTSASNGDGA